MCLDVTYVLGHAEPARSFILFICNTTGNDMYNGTINETANCIEVDPHPSYNILVTDNDPDAVEQVINSAVAPVTIMGVVVPNFTATVSSSNTGEYNNYDYLIIKLLWFVLILTISNTITIQ